MTQKAKTDLGQKVLLAALVPILAGLIAWGTLRADVSHNTDGIQANSAEIRTSEQRVMDRLDRIEDKLDRVIESTR